MSYGSKIRQDIISNPITYGGCTSCGDSCQKYCSVDCTARCESDCKDECYYTCKNGCSDRCGHTCSSSCAEQCRNGPGINANNNLF